MLSKFYSGNSALHRKYCSIQPKVQQAPALATALWNTTLGAATSVRRGTKVTYWNYSGTVFHSASVRLLSRVQQTANEFNGFNAARSTPTASSTWEKHATHATDSSEFHAAKTNGCSCLGVDLKSMDYTPSNCRVTRDNTPVIMHVLLSQIFRI